MALSAHNRAVRSRQREFRTRRMVEYRPLPACRAVAHGAILREAGGHVVQSGRVGVIGDVARDARSRQARVHVVLVALGTTHRGMAAGQGEVSESVIEPGTHP